MAALCLNYVMSLYQSMVLIRLQADWMIIAAAFSLCLYI